MLRNVLVASFLIGSACAMYLEYLKVDTKRHLDGTMIFTTSKGSVDHDEGLLMAEEKLPGVCWICQWVMKKVKANLGNQETAEKIKEKLKRGCESIGLVKRLCKKMIDKHIDIFVEELSTDDDPKTICANIGICKSVDMLELIQALPQNYHIL